MFVSVTAVVGFPVMVVPITVAVMEFRFRIFYHLTTAR